MSSNNDAPLSSARGHAGGQPPNDAKIRLRDVRLSRGGRQVLHVDDLSLRRGEVSVVIGPNGSGKSTLLAALQLLVAPDSGELLLDGHSMRDDPLATRRRMASVFQEALLLSTGVRKNVETALGLHKVPRAERRERAERWLDRFGVAGLAERHARELSGGEAQRVSLARAFALEPEVLLLDEPFSALDAPTREALIDDFAQILGETEVTTVLITHDRDEALRLADSVVVLIDGDVRQVGPPAEVFGAPADEAVAAFVGVENVWPATLLRADRGVATYRLDACSDCELDVAAADPPKHALFAIRPEEITLAAIAEPRVEEQPTSARNHLPATVRGVQAAGPVVRVQLGAGSDGNIPVVVTLTRPSLEDLAIDVGSLVTITFKATAAHVIDHE